MARSKPFTIPRRLLQRRRAGKVTLREMALACGVSVSTIWWELKRRGLPSVASERRRLAILLHAQGLTLQEIGQRLGITPQRVGQLLKPREGTR